MSTYEDISDPGEEYMFTEDRFSETTYQNFIDLIA
jgi:hypothetical protein